MHRIRLSVKLLSVGLWVGRVYLHSHSAEGAGPVSPRLSVPQVKQGRTRHLHFLLEMPCSGCLLTNLLSACPG